MTGKNDPGTGKSSAGQTLRKRAEAKVAAGNKSFSDISASEMSTLIHELRIHQVELEMQNEELRKSQAETERSRQAYQDLWELSPVGYLIIDVAGRVTAVNRASQRFFGKPENSLLNERFATLVTPENQVPVHLMLERTADTGITEKQEVRILKPDGSANICLLEIGALEDEPGRKQIQAVLTDITEQKRAEDDLRKNEQEKIAILDSLVEHVVYYDRKMKVLWANEAAYESIHMKREDLRGQNCHEIWAKHLTPCEDCPVIKARDTGQPQMVEKMTPDGRWWYIKSHPVQDSNGHVTGMTEFTLDITERKRAEKIINRAKDELETKVEERTADLIAANEELRREIKVRQQAEKELQDSKMLLSTTFDALQDLMVVIDKDFRVVMSNWKDHDYISEIDRQGHPFCYEVFLNRNKPCDPCHALEVFATGEIKQLEFTNPIDGKVRDVRVLPMFDDHGEVVAVIEHCRDITEREQAEKALKDSEEKLHRLSSNLLKAREAERQRISFGLHDEMGQDLAVLKIQIKSIENQLRENQKALKKTCTRTRQQVDRIVENIRRISRGLSPTILHDLGLSAALKWMTQNFTQRTSTKVSLEMAAIDPLFNEEAKIIIYRIFQEVFANIEKHAQATQVAVAIAKKKDRVVIKMEDNGCGFDFKEVMARDWPEKGLGLTTMDERARILRGPIERVSRKGKGTRVTLTIPINKKGSGQ